MTNWVVWPECPVKWIEVNGLFLVRPGYEYLFTNSPAVVTDEYTA